MSIQSIYVNQSTVYDLILLFSLCQLYVGLCCITVMFIDVKKRKKLQEEKTLKTRSCEKIKTLNKRIIKKT